MRLWMRLYATLIYARVGNLQPLAHIHKLRTIHACNVVLGLVVECRNVSSIDSAYTTTHTHTHTHTHTQTYTPVYTELLVPALSRPPDVVTMVNSYSVSGSRKSMVHDVSVARGYTVVGMPLLLM